MRNFFLAAILFLIGSSTAFANNYQGKLFGYGWENGNLYLTFIYNATYHRMPVNSTIDKKCILAMLACAIQQGDAEAVNIETDNADTEILMLNFIRGDQTGALKAYGCNRGDIYITLESSYRKISSAIDKQQFTASLLSAVVNGNAKTINFSPASGVIEMITFVKEN